jgi:NAD(P)-dependent dehydrogenase (short-subunit alcohol dehydrogenase family)
MSGSKSTNRVAVITGASRGIGRAIAEALAAQGYQVIAAARTLPQPGTGLIPMCVDVTDAASVHGLFAEVRHRFGNLSVLVNNAGLAGGATFGSSEEAAAWPAIIATNLTGAWLCAREASPLLTNDQGRIINIASVLGLRGAPDQLAYASAKHGLIGLTRSLALALAERQITVNALCPGWVATPMAEARFQDLGITEADAAAGTPTGRITTPEEVAALTVYLASSAARNLTGQVITLDGGGLAAP